jgi:MioC protein
VNVTVLYGTESGNAETVADDLVAEFADEFEIVSLDMTDATLDDLSPDTFYLVVCSTHGDGELPASAVPFGALLDEHRPDLTGVRYAVFGLGDSSYETYSRGSEHVDRRFTELGAVRVGEYGRHDARDGSLANDAALEWARALVASQALSAVAR